MSDIFNTEEFVKMYYEMLEGFDNTYVTDTFKKYIPKNCKVLELGFATGLDYFNLKESYDITLSDYSKAFIDAFYNNHHIKAIQIDARDIQLEDKFDCIYSSKVLHVFTDEELCQSFTTQHKSLNENGYIFHTFWYNKQAISDEHANRVNKTKLEKLLKGLFKITKTIIYSEDSESDSLILIAKKI